MRVPLIAGNWKMYKTAREAADTVRSLCGQVAEVTGVEVVVCPPFTALLSAIGAASGSRIAVGAQNCYWEKEGAFTGEISVPMLADLGCRYVIVGHSERRQYFGETDASVDKKIGAVLAHGLTCIGCLGETLQERESGQTFSVLERQVRGGFARHIISRNLVIAYEPVWAIGTGKTATPAQAQEAQKYIRDLLKKLYNKDTADNLRIQYGGSVKPENISDLMKQPDVDGALVGGASLSVESFSTIVKKASEVVK
jgi:triosephosphate isomerase